MYMIEIISNTDIQQYLKLQRSRFPTPGAPNLNVFALSRVEQRIGLFVVLLS